MPARPPVPERRTAWKILRAAGQGSVSSPVGQAALPQEAKPRGSELARAPPRGCRGDPRCPQVLTGAILARAKRRGGTQAWCVCLANSGCRTRLPPSSPAAAGARWTLVPPWPRAVAGRALRLRVIPWTGATANARDKCGQVGLALEGGSSLGAPEPPAPGLPSAESALAPSPGGLLREGAAPGPGAEHSQRPWSPTRHGARLVSQRCTQPRGAGAALPAAQRRRLRPREAKGPVRAAGAAPRRQPGSRGSPCRWARERPRLQGCSWAGLADPTPKPAPGTWGAVPPRGPIWSSLVRGPGHRPARGSQRAWGGCGAQSPHPTPRSPCSRMAWAGVRERTGLIPRPAQHPSRGRVRHGTGFAARGHCRPPLCGESPRADTSLSPRRGVLAQPVPGCPHTGWFRKEPASGPHPEVPGCGRCPTRGRTCRRLGLRAPCWPRGTRPCERQSLPQSHQPWGTRAAS